jgi:hypothetical protein
MPQEITITSVTANTPVDIYYCDSMSASCVYVSTVAVFPYVFSVPAPYDEEDIVIKIVDTQGCVDGDIIYITPTPTPSITPSNTVTPTVTTTPTNTPTQTTTTTPTPTTTLTLTPTTTPTPSVTPVVAGHLVGQNTHALSGNACGDIITVQSYYTYISQANTVPVIGVKVYTTLVGGVLYNPFNGGNKFIKMVFGGNNYAVQINSSGDIVSFASC